MNYLDTSLVMSLVTVEPSTATAQEWAATASDDGLAISDWVVTEVASALSLVERVGRLDSAGRARAWNNFQELITTAATVLSVSRQAFHAAADMTGHATLTLRAGDALHLAVAREHDAVLCTRDIRQASAGSRLGIHTQLVASGAGS